MNADKVNICCSAEINSPLALLLFKELYELTYQN